MPKSKPLLKISDLCRQSLRSFAPALISCMVLSASLSGAIAVEQVERRDLGDLPLSVDSSTGAVTPTERTDGTLEEVTQAEQPMPPLPAESSVVDANSGTDNTISLLETKPPLRIGMMAERGATYLQTRIEPFRRYMQETLDRPVEIVAFNSIEMLIAAHTGRQVDYASYPASVFAMAHASCGCLVPLAAPVSSQAPDGIYMLLLVRGDSGIQSLADMTGRSMALSSKAGALPFHMALNELRRSGLNPEIDLATVFSKSNPSEALTMLEKGEADGALVWSTTQFNQTLFSSIGALSAFQDTKQGKRKQAPPQPDFRTIWRSPAIPAGPHVVHDQVSKQDRADLVNALTAMAKRDPEAYDAIERYFGAGFRSVTLEDYSPLIDIATARR